MIVRKAERRDAETLFDFVLRLDRDGAPVRGPEMSVDDIMAAGFGPNPQPVSIPAPPSVQ